MSPTRSPLSHPGGRECVDGDISVLDKSTENTRTFFSSHSIIGKLFQIRIFLRADYYKEEVEEESEVEDELEEEKEEEEEEPPRISRSFKTDHCVICMENQPKFLFYACMHISVYSNCEENTLNHCPYCRAIMIEKICI